MHFEKRSSCLQPEDVAHFVEARSCLRLFKVGCARGTLHYRRGLIMWSLVADIYPCMLTDAQQSSPSLSPHHHASPEGVYLKFHTQARKAFVITQRFSFKALPGTQS